MQDEDRSKGQLITELQELRRRVAELERDKAERKQAEEVLRESEEKYRSLFEHSQDAILLTVPDGSILDANQAACKMFGRSLDEIKNVGRSGLVDMTDPRLHTVLSERALTGIASGEITMLRANGDKFPVEITSKVFVGARGRQKTSMIIRDISERKRPEEALEERDIQFKKLFLHVPGMIYQFMKRPDGTYCVPFTTEAIKDIFGCSSQDVRVDFSPITRVVFPEDLNKLIDSIESSAERMTTWQCEYRVQVPGRPIRWMFGQSTPEKLADGSVIWHGFNTDITERKWAEDALRRSQRQLADIIEFFPDATFVINNAGTVIAWNRAMEAMTGVSKNEMIGKGDFEYSVFFFGNKRPMLIDLLFASEEQKTKYYDSVSTVGGGAVVETYAPQTYGGKGAYLWGVATALFDEQGNVVGAIESIRDITERKLAATLLQQSEERLRLALHAANQGLYDLNVQTGEAQVSPEYATMLGYDPAEFRETNAAWIERLHPEDRDPVAAIYRDYIDGKIPEYQVEFRQRTKSGGWKWILSLGRIVEWNAGGEPLRMLGTHTDITERKLAVEEREKLQAQLNQAQKMESVGRLAGGVAHDFNNMLGVIIGRAEMALGTDIATDDLQQSLQEILKAAQRSAELTRQLLAFARKQTVAPKVLDLNETVEGMLKMLRRLIGEDIALAWLPGKNLWPVRVDPSQIDQILANLCVNARDAIAGAGKVTIETGTASMDESYCTHHVGSTAGEYVLLVVSDNGCGMDKATFGKLFEPFFTTKGVGKGTGLGLATVYGIVKQNNGFINVYSEPGHGTTFKIYIPRHAGSIIEDRMASAAKIPRGRGETVLLVEDEHAILSMTATMLERQGYSVLAASRPGEALRLAEKHTGQIHLLMTDVVMPEMNGRDLAKNILLLYPNLKSLFMSGYTANVIAHSGVLDEGVHFIQKPFSIEELAFRVRETLDE